MKSINKILILFLLFSNTSIAQETLNNYKYIIVPEKYDFLKSEDQFQLNSLTKFLFKKEGFEVLFDSDARPKDLINNPCSALIPKVKNQSGMFTTKLVIELLNCRNQVIFTSTEGRSKEKDYKKSYHQALRNAFESISSLHYKYSPSKAPLQVEEVKKELVEAATIKEEKEATAVSEVIKESVPVVENKAPAPSIIEKVEAPIKVTESKEQTLPANIEIDNNLLYAQANSLGFQLVDSTPKVAYLLLKSSNKDLFFLKNKKGILYKKNGQWIVEYYEIDKLIQKVLTIKF